MTVRISGVLKDGTGKPVPGCTIELKARRTTETVIVTTVAQGQPGETGSYSFDVEPGWYRVTLNTEGYAPSYVGDILVKADSEPGTLNKFLMEQDEAQYYPKALAELEAVAAEILKRAEASAASAEEAKKRAENARGPAGEKGTQVHRVPQGHRDQPGQRENGEKQVHRDRRAIKVTRADRRGRKVTPAHVERPDHPDHRVRQGKPARKGIKVNPAQQVRQVPQALGEKPAPQVLRVPQAVSPVFRMPAHHRKVLYS